MKAVSAFHVSVLPKAAIRAGAAKTTEYKIRRRRNPIKAG